jgi:hypothetical protein
MYSQYLEKQRIYTIFCKSITNMMLGQLYDKMST